MNLERELKRIRCFVWRGKERLRCAVFWCVCVWIYGEVIIELLLGLELNFWKCWWSFWGKIVCFAQWSFGSEFLSLNFEWTLVSFGGKRWFAWKEKWDWDELNFWKCWWNFKGKRIVVLNKKRKYWDVLKFTKWIFGLR